MVEEITREMVKTTLDSLTKSISSSDAEYFTSELIIERIGHYLGKPIDTTSPKIKYLVKNYLDHYVRMGEVSKIRVRDSSDYLFDLFIFKSK
ncbi:hypothetical protein HYU21_04000 [Candidatus Woesearchaeota archaeon]|nr:hypothetical protein [Candidatus Woesearchaeota archaeon]